MADDRKGLTFDDDGSATNTYRIYLTVVMHDYLTPWRQNPRVHHSIHNSPKYVCNTIAYNLTPWNTRLFERPVQKFPVVYETRELATW
jgi:hypothetical protein